MGIRFISDLPKTSSNICLFIMKEFFFLCLLASVAAISEDGGVLILTEANFEDALSAHKLSLVEFYAPWCGHCKELAPEYIKAATILLEKESNIKLAKVDATEQPKLAEKFGVKGYPTLKFFRGGKTTDAEYEGNRTAGAIVSWLEKKTTPRTKALETLEAAREFVESLDVAVIGFFEDDTNAAAKAFKDASIEVDDYEFAITSNDEIRDEYKVEGDSVIVIKKIDGTETVSRISDVTSEADISTFVKFKALPPVMDFNPQTAKKIFSGVVQAHLLLFMSSTAEGHKDRLDMAKEVAKENEGSLLFVTVDTDVEDNKRMLDFFGLKEAELPSFRAIVLSDDMSMANTIKYKPEDWADKGVKYLVGENFASVAMDEEKNVLVEFYAPWCGHCKELAPVWDELGEKYKDHENIVIAKIDATANELVDVNVQGFPTIKLFKKETSEVVDFDGKRTMEGFVKFLESGGQNEKIIKTKEGDEAPSKEEAKKEEL